MTRTAEPPVPALIDTHEASRRLGVAYTTLRISRATGVLMGRKAPAYLKLGRAVRYEQDTIAEWIRGASIRTRVHDDNENDSSNHEKEETA